MFKIKTPFTCNSEHVFSRKQLNIKQVMTRIKTKVRCISSRKSGPNQETVKFSMCDDLDPKDESVDHTHVAVSVTAVVENNNADTPYFGEGETYTLDIMSSSE